jgi:hypothetical protein
MGADNVLLELRLYHVFGLTGPKGQGRLAHLLAKRIQSLRSQRWIGSLSAASGHCRLERSNGATQVFPAGLNAGVGQPTGRAFCAASLFAPVDENPTRVRMLAVAPCSNHPLHPFLSRIVQRLGKQLIG